MLPVTAIEQRQAATVITAEHPLHSLVEGICAGRGRRHPNCDQQPLSLLSVDHDNWCTISQSAEQMGAPPLLVSICRTLRAVFLGSLFLRAALLPYFAHC